jgi:fucose 4-O-acetylase-like acetyltransferase
MGKKILHDVERAKGLAIFLVVLGHLKADIYPAGNEWYRQLCMVLYKFHMPFLMFLTGLIMFYIYPAIETSQDYISYVKKKFFRLIPAYIIFALLIAVGKTLAGQFAYIENPVHGFKGFIDVFVCPNSSYARSLWYVYVVFIYFLIVPILLKLFKQNFEALLLFTLALYFVPRTQYFAQSQVFEYMFVFLCGCYAARHLNKYTVLIDQYSWVFNVAFAGFLILALQISVPKLMLGLLSIPALHSLVRWRTVERMRLLGYLGKFIFPIYLMNTMAIGFIKALVQKYWSWDGRNFLIVAPILLISGIVLPILVQKYFISRLPILKKVVY